MNTQSTSLKLQSWYETQARDLPWRKDKNPYKVWISEIMLQQTTVTAVIPYFKNFIFHFPDIESLAIASERDVFQQWSGLGYYSRAKNILKTAKQIKAIGYFPQTWKELILLPGVGDYTSRAISSIAFSEKVGVVDGNVIRFLCRFYGLELEWWKSKEKNKIQVIADSLAKNGKSDLLNQALMEMGSLICSKSKPQCSICPVQLECLSLKSDKILTLPLVKPKKQNVMILWQPNILLKNDKVAFIRNNYLPFLKQQWVLPGSFKIVNKKPHSFDFSHAITHYKIFVKKSSKVNRSQDNFNWISVKESKKISPFSLIQKCLKT